MGPQNGGSGGAGLTHETLALVAARVAVLVEGVLFKFLDLGLVLVHKVETVFSSSGLAAVLLAILLGRR